MTSRSLSDAEIANVLERLTSLRDKCLFILGVKTGFRISEILSLTPADVQGDTITVRRCNMKGKRSSRSVPLHPIAKAAVKAYLDALGCPPLRLFPMTRQHARRIISGAAKAAGLAGCISTHSMRKTFGMRVYQVTGKNVVAAQRALGHASLASTSHYLSIGQDEVDAAILA